MDEGVLDGKGNDDDDSFTSRQKAWLLEARNRLRPLEDDETPRQVWWRGDVDDEIEGHPWLTHLGDAPSSRGQGMRERTVDSDTWSVDGRTGSKTSADAALFDACVGTGWNDVGSGATSQPGDRSSPCGKIESRAAVGSLEGLYDSSSEPIIRDSNNRERMKKTTSVAASLQSTTSGGTEDDTSAARTYGFQQRRHTGVQTEPGSCLEGGRPTSNLEAATSRDAMVQGSGAALFPPVDSRPSQQSPTPAPVGDAKHLPRPRQPAGFLEELRQKQQRMLERRNAATVVVSNEANSRREGVIVTAASSQTAPMSASSSSAVASSPCDPSSRVERSTQAKYVPPSHSTSAQRSGAIAALAAALGGKLQLRTPEGVLPVEKGEEERASPGRVVTGRGDRAVVSSQQPVDETFQTNTTRRDGPEAEAEEEGGFTEGGRQAAQPASAVPPLREESSGTTTPATQPGSFEGGDDSAGGSLMGRNEEGHLVAVSVTQQDCLETPSALDEAWGDDEEYMCTTTLSSGGRIVVPAIAAGPRGRMDAAESMKDRAASLQDKAASLQDKAASLQDKAASLQDRAASLQDSAVPVIKTTEPGVVSSEWPESKMETLKSPSPHAEDSQKVAIPIEKKTPMLPYFPNSCIEDVRSVLKFGSPPSNTTSILSPSPTDHPSSALPHGLFTTALAVPALLVVPSSVQQPCAAPMSPANRPPGPLPPSPNMSIPPSRSSQCRGGSTTSSVHGDVAGPLLATAETPRGDATTSSPSRYSTGHADDGSFRLVTGSAFSSIIRIPSDTGSVEESDFYLDIPEGHNPFSQLPLFTPVPELKDANSGGGGSGRGLVNWPSPRKALISLSPTEAAGSHTGVSSATSSASGSSSSHWKTMPLNLFSTTTSLLSGGEGTGGVALPCEAQQLQQQQLSSTFPTMSRFLPLQHVQQQEAATADPMSPPRTQPCPNGVVYYRAGLPATPGPQERLPRPRASKMTDEPLPRSCTSPTS